MAVDLRNDFMDIYLAANCTLCISASSGFEAVPLAFRKPLVMIVVPLMDAKTWSDKVLILTRHYFSKQKKKKLLRSQQKNMQGRTIRHDQKIVIFC